MATPITIVIPTRNEAAQISECVRHLAWAGEVIVVDATSTDGTPELARAAGARVIARDGPTVAAQRNAGIAAASHDWVFALDADERIGPDLARELGRVAGAPAHEAYAVRRRNVYLGKAMTRAGWGRDWVVRLFRRGRRFLERRVHEGLEPVADVGRLAAPLEHVPYRDLAHHLGKVDRYSAWAAADLAEGGRRARMADLLLRPPARFVRMYVFQLGMLEGWRGAVLSGFGAMSVFLKYARLWERSR
ncbi:MAG TPA: glycosyltransferase family 2 protein [Gemmatimonadales bacterium]|nr:glycosyltransferase family 2 protein [Gemmatimonadales bacterium]HYT84226.1 glycosyltransferase family 2 protein [Gemmatimonadales bacterium]